MRSFSDTVYWFVDRSDSRGRPGGRLGGIDKSALLVGSDSILDRQLALLRELTPHILIVAGQTPKIAPARYDSRDGSHARGGSARRSVYGARRAPTEQVLVIACDMPFLTAPFLARLAERGKASMLPLPRDERGRHPLCASYDRRIAAHLKARSIAASCGR
jgi:molybdopterin-guanine dinucleotide biosynthesis protein A